ncbi:MAG: KaiC domain-containing protein [Halorhabdus sp.]
MSDGDGDDWFERALADAAESDDRDDWFPEGDPDDGGTAVSEPTTESAHEDRDVDRSGADTMETDTTDGAPLFEEDFSSAMASASGPDESGQPATDGEDFGDEEFDSDIPRIDLGIDGLDEMIQGGIPTRHLMVVIGAPGTGKTTFGLQFLNHGLERGENAVFVTLEQSRESIIDTANERGWAFDRYEREDRLAIVDLDPVEMANSLENIRGEFPQLVREFGADRLVLDSVSLLEMMYDDQSRRRTEVFDFTRSLKAAGVTTMVTSEASDDNPYASRHGIIEYLTDAVFVLQYVRGDTQETRLAVEIQKIRNANHSRATKPYAITLDGIDVYQQASIF